jgi:3'-5' exonuclease
MAFAVFDIETRIDKRLLNQVYFPGESLSDEDAYARFREDLIKRRGGDFFQLTLHIPISIAIGNVGSDYALTSIETLAVNDYSEEKLAREFWSRAERFDGTLVSFNGSRFDIPVLELAALRYGIAARNHFARGLTEGLYRVALERLTNGIYRHFDLHDFIGSHGAFALTGGLDLLLKLIGMPGKTTMDGSRVQEAFEAGRIDEIHRYCRDDVAQTYFLFLRVQLIRGEISEATYRAAYERSSHFIGANQ